MVKPLNSIGPIHVRSRAKASVAVALALAFCLGGCADEPGENASQAGNPAFAGGGGSVVSDGILTGGVIASPPEDSNTASSDAAGGFAAVTDGGGGVSGSSDAGYSDLTDAGNGNDGGAGASGTDGAAEAGAAEAGAAEAGADDSGSAGSLHPTAWRIMPLGDSITETTCYPHLLWKKLRDTGHSNFDFVGTKINNQDCGVSNPDQDCEGHSAYKVTELLPNESHAAELPRWCSQDEAEIVLMHFGTNDAWSSVDTQRIIDAYSTILTALRAANPKVILFVAQIIGLIPINTPECPSCACPTCDEQVKKLNAAIPNWAQANSTTDSPIHVVDLYTGFEPADDTRDGVHPNLKGAQKMADGWYNAIIARNLF
ncbi:MAG: cellulose-binding protein [Deltaproteobacteria bacterium]|nr:cellulose-binding protein [Deltaproteobacteria bacterium]